MCRAAAAGFGFWHTTNKTNCVVSGKLCDSGTQYPQLYSLNIITKYIESSIYMALY